MTHCNIAGIRIHLYLWIDWRPQSAIHQFLFQLGIPTLIKHTHSRYMERSFTVTHTFNILANTSFEFVCNNYIFFSRICAMNVMMPTLGRLFIIFLGFYNFISLLSDIFRIEGRWSACHVLQLCVLSAYNFDIYINVPSSIIYCLVQFKNTCDEFDVDVFPEVVCGKPKIIFCVWAITHKNIQDVISICFERPKHFCGVLGISHEELFMGYSNCVIVGIYELHLGVFWYTFFCYGIFRVKWIYIPRRQPETNRFVKID